MGICLPQKLSVTAGLRVVLRPRLPGTKNAVRKHRWDKMHPKDRFVQCG